jgi:hypothetical protein
MILLRLHSVLPKTDILGQIKFGIARRWLRPPPPEPRSLFAPSSLLRASLWHGTSHLLSLKRGPSPGGCLNRRQQFLIFQRVRSHGPQRIFADLESVAGDLLGDSNRGEFRAQCQKWNKTKFMWAVRGHGTG